MSFRLNYGEPDWNERPQVQHGAHERDLPQHLLSNDSYEELRFEATKTQWTSKFLDLNKNAVSPGSNATFVNLMNLTDMVDVVVGPQDTKTHGRWVIHQQLLVGDSEFAALALKGNFKETKERVIRFPEENPEVFAHYVRWIYTSCILTFSLEMLVQMYTLADRLQSLKFANACYQTLAKNTDLYNPEQIKYLLDNTYEDDRLRKLCTTQIGRGVLAGKYSFSTDHDRELLKDYMPELMQGVTAAVAESIKEGQGIFPDAQSSTKNDRRAFQISSELGNKGFGQFYADIQPSSSNLFGSGSSYNYATGQPFGSGSLPFGNNSTHPPGGGAFGSSAPATGASNGLFGNPVASLTSTPSGFGLPPTTASGAGAFGNPVSSTTSAQSLFSLPPTTASSNGLFGSTVPYPSSNPLGFGSPRVTPSGGGAFGNDVPNTASAQSSSGQSSATTSGTGFFNTPIMNPTSTHTTRFGLPRVAPLGDSLFGNHVSNTISTQSRSDQPPPATASGNGLFGTSGTNTTTVQSIFGQPCVATSSTSLFGAPATNTASTQDSGRHTPTFNPHGLFGSAMDDAAFRPAKSSFASAATTENLSAEISRGTSSATDDPSTSTTWGPFQFPPNPKPIPGSAPAASNVNSASSGSGLLGGTSATITHPLVASSDAAGNDTEAASTSVSQHATTTGQNAKHHDPTPFNPFIPNKPSLFGHPSKTATSASGWRPAEHGQPSRIVSTGSFCFGSPEKSSQSIKPVETSVTGFDAGKGKERISPPSFLFSAPSEPVFKATVPKKDSGTLFSLFCAEASKKEILSNPKGGDVTPDGEDAAEDNEAGKENNSPHKSGKDDDDDGILVEGLMK
jgi:BTB/POZ domain